MEMADAECSLDYWRKLFSSVTSDIFELIDKAIMVAAEDCPKEFNDRRDKIMEKLYTSHLSLNNGDDEYSKEVKDSSKSDKPEQNDQIVGEVMRIKEVLSSNKLYESDSDSILFESLRTLHQMELSADTLKTTEIGRTVCALRGHNSSKIQKLARSLVESWRVLDDEWVDSTAKTTSKTATDSFSMLKEPANITSEQKPNYQLSVGVKRKQSEEVSDMSKLDIAKKQRMINDDKKR